MRPAIPLRSNFSVWSHSASVAVFSCRHVYAIRPLEDRGLGGVSRFVANGRARLLRERLNRCIRNDGQDDSKGNHDGGNKPSFHDARFLLGIGWFISALAGANRRCCRLQSRRACSSVRSGCSKWELTSASLGFSTFSAVTSRHPFRSRFSGTSRGWHRRCPLANRALTYPSLIRPRAF
jgi:hypothetical protein